MMRHAIGNLRECIDFGPWEPVVTGVRAEEHVGGFPGAVCCTGLFEDDGYSLPIP